MTQREWDQAYDAGRAARRSGRGRDTCPRYGIIPEARKLVERWYLGWDDEDRERNERRAQP